MTTHRQTTGRQDNSATALFHRQPTRRHDHWPTRQVTDNFWCLVVVGRLFLAVPRGCLRFVIVVFPDHTHLLFSMELVLRGLNWDKCLCYLDDIIVFGKTFEEDLQNWKIGFQRFRGANLKLKPFKCSLFQIVISLVK